MSTKVVKKYSPSMFAEAFTDWVQICNECKGDGFIFAVSQANPTRPHGVVECLNCKGEGFTLKGDGEKIVNFIEWYMAHRTETE